VIIVGVRVQNEGQIAQILCQVLAARREHLRVSLHRIDHPAGVGQRNQITARAREPEAVVEGAAFPLADHPAPQHGGGCFVLRADALFPFVGQMPDFSFHNRLLYRFLMLSRIIWHVLSE